MNPFTQFLLEAIPDPDLIDFVHLWDGLEALVIQVYRGELEPGSVSDEFTARRTALLGVYPRWVQALTPYWKGTKIAGEPTSQDPFQALLAIPGPEKIPGNWPLMQTLPPARESLNLYLQARVHGNEG